MKESESQSKPLSTPQGQAVRTAKLNPQSPATQTNEEPPESMSRLLHHLSRYNIVEPKGLPNKLGWGRTGTQVGCRPQNVHNSVYHTAALCAHPPGTHEALRQRKGWDKVSTATTGETRRHNATATLKYTVNMSRCHCLTLS